MTGDRCDLLCVNIPLAEALRADRLSNEDAETMARGAQALGDPTRLMVASVLASADELCVCDLSWICERSDNLVSHHLRQLKNAGLATSRREGKMVMYALTPYGHNLLDAVMAPNLKPATTATKEQAT